MRSIRGGLVLRLLTGLGLLWLAIGCGLFFTVRHARIAALDAELGLLAQEVRYLIPEGRFLRQAPPSDRWLDFFEPDSGLYFEVWDTDFLFSDRSPSLGERGLPVPASAGAEATFRNARLKRDEPVRLVFQTLELPLLDPDLGPAVVEFTVVVARNRAGLNRDLALLVVATAAAGLLMLGLTAVIVRLAVRGGLHPLRAVDERLLAIDADSLHERFDTESTPEELQPVLGRLNDLMSRLEAGFERERRFSADLAHELRTPVAELKTLAEVAIRLPDRAGPGDYEEVLEIANHMQTTLETLLALARNEQGASPVREHPVPMGPLVAECWGPSEGTAVEKGLVVNLPDTGEWSVPGDPEMLRVILRNLIANAVAYTPVGGRVTLKAGESGSACILGVENTVENLEEADLERFFDRFWRADRSRTDADHSGLGLTLARSCARAMGMDLRPRFGRATGLLAMELVRAGEK